MQLRLHRAYSQELLFGPDLGLLEQSTEEMCDDIDVNWE